MYFIIVNEIVERERERELRSNVSYYEKYFREEEGGRGRMRAGEGEGKGKRIEREKERE